MGYTPI